MGFIIGPRMMMRRRRGLRPFAAAPPDVRTGGAMLCGSTLNAVGEKHSLWSWCSKYSVCSHACVSVCVMVPTSWSNISTCMSYVCVSQNVLAGLFSLRLIVLQQQLEKDGLSVKHMLGTRWWFISDRLPDFTLVVLTHNQNTFFHSHMHTDLHPFPHVAPLLT